MSAGVWSKSPEAFMLPFESSVGSWTPARVPEVAPKAPEPKNPSGLAIFIVSFIEVLITLPLRDAADPFAVRW